MATLKIQVANSGSYKDMYGLDHSYNCKFAYRMQTDLKKESATFHFQTVGLPREAHLAYMRDKESLIRSWDDASLIYVAKIDDYMVGYIVVEAKTLALTARVNNLVVMPELRRKGIARTLLAAVEGWASRNDLERILIEIPMRNFPMVELASNCGYEICGFLEQYFPNGDPALFYDKRLN